MNKPTFLFSAPQRGDSLLEVILSMTIVAMVAPFLYSQISDATDRLRDLSIANNIIAHQDSVLNFIRINQDAWPEVAQIKLDAAELKQISDAPHAGFIDKYTVQGATMTDVYLAFDLGADAVRTNKIARDIGMDAAVVSSDGVAYGSSFAVAAPDFKEGDLIYRITRNTNGVDKTKYLHRASAGEQGLNIMQRDLHMGINNIYDIGTAFASSAGFDGITTTFLETESLAADNVYFSSGANVQGGNMYIGSLRVTGDITGFRNIYADTLNGRSHTTSTNIITDRASVENSLNVARDLVLKTDSSITVSSFTALSANAVATPYLVTEELVFFEDFGLTVSGELMMSTTSPIRFGSWAFPSTTPPRFSVLKLTRGTLPDAPQKNEFDKIMKSGWKSYAPISATNPLTSLAPTQQRKTSTIRSLR